MIATSSESSTEKNVKRILMSQPWSGSREKAIGLLSESSDVTAVFKRAASADFHDDPPSSILFPIFDTGPGGGDLNDHAERLVDVAVECLESRLGGPVRKAYFYAWSDVRGR